MKPVLVVMIKVPRAGRVKTRLGRDIGMVSAAWWFRHQSARLLRRLRDRRWQIVLAVSPDQAGLASRVWPADLVRIPQGQGDLGSRMHRALQFCANGPVCVIGADIPGVTRAHIARAFAALGGADLVFGPALDGGFWLVGAHRGGGTPVTLFQGVRWSGPHALADSIASAAGARIALVDRLQDVDDVADMRAARLP